MSNIRLVIHNQNKFDVLISGRESYLHYDVPYHYDIDTYIKTTLNRLYKLIFNGLTEIDIDNLIAVNIVGYKRARTWLDIRYTLTPQGTMIPLIRNVDFEVRPDQYKDAFDLAINQCIQDFDSFRLNLIHDDSFRQQFENLLNTEKYYVR